MGSKSGGEDEEQWALSVLAVDATMSVSIRKPVKGVLSMDLRLSEELEMLRDTARRFAEEHIAPYAQQWDAAAYYPDDLIKKLGDQGFMGILLPEEYGGSAGSVTAFAVILEELARHDGGLCLAVEAHNGLCCSHIMIAGNEEQKKRFLHALAAGAQLAAWCLS